jgi:membrane protein
LIGTKGAKGLTDLIAAQQHNVVRTPAIVATVLVLAAIGGIFLQLQEALDDIWDIPEHERGGLWEIVALRLHVVIVVLALGLLAIVAILSAVLGGRMAAIAANVTALFVFLTVAYRVLPRVSASWKSCLLGAGITAGVLLVGEVLVSLYFTHFHPETAYGSAGSFVVVLLWIYYSAMLFLFGATLTRTIEGDR